MKFRVKKGLHMQDGKVYEAGDIVESDKDLTEIFNPDKFEKAETEVQEVVKTVYVSFKNDVSKEFPGCKETGHSVYHEKNLYYVVKDETGHPIHETKLQHKDTVREIIKGLK